MNCPRCESEDIVELVQYIYTQKKRKITIVRRIYLYECLDCNRQFSSDELKYMR